LVFIPLFYNRFYERIVMVKVTPAQFVRQVRQEVSKVSWPSRKETGIGTLMVFIMVFLAAAFFFVVDLALSWGVQKILGLGG
jgi:preprotein translocase subunit SecE